MFEEGMMKAFLTLGICVLFLGGILLIVKKYAKKTKKLKNGFDLEVISRTSLNQKNHLYVVKAGEKTLLIGVSDHNINTLSDLTEEKHLNPANIQNKSVHQASRPSGKLNGIHKEIENKNKIENLEDFDDVNFGNYLKSIFKNKK